MICTFSPDGQFFTVTEGVSDLGGRTTVVNAKTGQVISIADECCWPTAWSPDSKRLASANPTPSTWRVTLCDALTGEFLFTRTCDDEVTALAWSPDGSALASGSPDGTITIWAAETGFW